MSTEKLIRLWSTDYDKLSTVYQLRAALECHLPAEAKITHNFTNAFMPVPDDPNTQVVGHGIRLEITIPSQKKIVVSYPVVVNISKDRIHCAALRQASSMNQLRLTKIGEALQKEAMKRYEPRVVTTSEQPSVAVEDEKK
jgi:hypothetical protein